MKIDCPEGAERAAPDPLSVMCRSMPGKSRESDACPSAHLSARFGSIARLFLGVPTAAGVVEDPSGPLVVGKLGDRHDVQHGVGRQNGWISPGADRWWPGALVLARGRVHRLASLAEAGSEARLLRRQPRSSVIAARQQGHWEIYQPPPARCSAVPDRGGHL